MFGGSVPYEAWKTARTALILLVAVPIGLLLIITILAALTPPAEGAAASAVSASLTKPDASGEPPGKGCCLKCRCGLALHNCCDGCVHLAIMPDPSKKERRITQVARSICTRCCAYKRRLDEKKSGH